jgi:hypothetical protein
VDVLPGSFDAKSLPPLPSFAVFFDLEVWKSFWRDFMIVSRR